MAWRDGLRQGSFRGVPFHFSAGEGEHGHRVVKHVYPLRDGADGEDLGLQEPRFQLDVFVQDNVFSSYKAKRDALIAACEKPGTGQLVHPTLGEMTVYCSCRWSESVELMGVCHFELTFWKPAMQAPLTATDPAAATAASAKNASQAASNSFARRFSISGLEKQVGAGFQSIFGSVIAAIRQGASYVQMATALPGQIVGFVDGQANNAVGFLNSLGGGSGGILSSIRTLMNLPSALSLRFAGLIQSLSFAGQSNTPIQLSDWETARDIGPQSVQARGQVPQGYTQATLDSIRQAQLAIADALATTDVSVLRSDGALPPSGVGAPLPLAPDVAGITAPQARQIAAASTPALIVAASPVEGATSSQVQQAINQVELLDLGRRTALIEAAQAAVASAFASSNDAIAVRDALMDLFDVEIAVCTDDAVTAALIALRLAVFRDITQQAAYLPGLTTIVLNLPVPAVVLANRLYDDPSYADDIVARNGIVNALFVPAGVPLEVLSNG